MNQVRVKSWSNLQDELFSESYDPDLQRYRSRFAFRGLDDAKYKLDTTLIRLGGKYQELERHLLRNFRKYAHRDVVERDSMWHWLSVAQHHGLPTRLLDWTYSPYVALHFATADITKFNVDGVVWMVNFFEVHKYLPATLKAELKGVGGYGFDVEMLSNTFKTLDALDALAPPDFMIFFEPPSIDDRIVNQYAIFSVMSNPTITFDTWLKKRPNIFRKVIIPAKLKWEVRDKLDQANVTERVLFPGLDGLSRWLKRNYSPKT
ncbi:MAG: FRG domain-containing protein [Acidobacteria bacterium 13_1_20CM_3_53_8]|nr:MAG: FRG domain-containing protein [Acidobacteria bacterium 13_1_20CM_3_53_8]